MRCHACLPHASKPEGKSEDVSDRFRQSHQAPDRKQVLDRREIQAEAPASASTAQCSAAGMSTRQGVLDFGQRIKSEGNEAPLISVGICEYRVVAKN